MNAFSRTELLFGADAMERLAKARVAVFGVGGVGGYAVEALARSGVGALDLVDDDTVCESNLNRQIIATRATIGKRPEKAVVALAVPPGKAAWFPYRCRILPAAVRFSDRTGNRGTPESAAYGDR